MHEHVRNKKTGKSPQITYIHIYIHTHIGVNVYNWGVDKKTAQSAHYLNTIEKADRPDGTAAVKDLSKVWSSLGDFCKSFVLVFCRQICA